jgi:3-oxoacyl-[acyl-carrier-protein] synthase-3
VRYEHVSVAAIGYELPPVVVTSRALEERLAPVYQRLHLQPGQLEALTGIRERRWWNPGQTMADGATRAGRRALAAAGVGAERVGMLVYGGVCRDHLEPATACAVAEALGVPAAAEVHDISNACLGVLNGMLQVADAIELGRLEAGLVVSCESAREIVESTIAGLQAGCDLETFTLSLATLTGGSGATAVLLARAGGQPAEHRLRAATVRNDVRHHRLCRWGGLEHEPGATPSQMRTEAARVLEHGVALGERTWGAFLPECPWGEAPPDKVVCHQVGAPNRTAILSSLGIPPERDFSTFAYLGNIGTVSLPISAAIAAERGFLRAGDRVGFLGIGSGLNCMMLALEW